MIYIIPYDISIFFRINLRPHTLEGYVFHAETYWRISMFYRRGVSSWNWETSGLRVSCIGFEVPVAFTMKSVFLRIVKALQSSLWSASFWCLARLTLRLLIWRSCVPPKRQNFANCTALPTFTSAVLSVSRIFFPLRSKRSSSLSIY
jgi:hypothetical protein